MLPSQAMVSMDQLWFAAARNCSVHSSTCSLHNTQQWRKGQGRLLHQRSRASHADSGAGEKDQSHQDFAEELLKADPAAQARLKRVGEAAALVASLQAEQAALARQIAEAEQASEAGSRQQERSQAQRAAERGAEADILAAERALSDAQGELEAATRERDWILASSSQDAERLESAKAGAVAAVGGLLGSLPYLAAAGHSSASTVLSAAQVAASCLLFGVTFRYVAAAHGGNDAQLKGGVVAAFGLVRGLAYADAAQISASEAGGSSVDAQVLGVSALAAGESMLTFGFAAAAVEYALRTGLVKPFGMALARD